ncbi:hypothetical protein N790_12175 [Arenimonas malthae CC-JY-1]|uniref:Choice-of-anchor D domain-containing protein n=2 Tax=Arenimonas TaxID=490567 RepID=A0A091ARH8_9GAMM|nr:hypothetical protein N790_12175 [Arenimonas malthae CC-JY-1]
MRPFRPSLVFSATLLATSAVQAVDLDAAPAAPRTYAAEIIATPDAPVELANPGGVLDLSTPLAYNFSVGEVRHVRIQCPGMRFGDDAVVSYLGGGLAGVGAVNGLGTDAIHFSITAGDNAVLAADRLLVTGTRAITSTNDVTCSYGLYDQPSQATGGGIVGRVVSRSGAYLAFAPSYLLRVDSQGQATADVEALYPPAFSAFVTAAPTFNRDLAQLGGFSHGTRQSLTGGLQPLTAAGTPITLADLLAPATALVFEGDFSRAADVYLSALADCSVPGQAADGFDEQRAVFTVGANEVLGQFLCYLSGDEPVEAGHYTVSLEAVPANPATYQVSGRGPLALGRITRNGTELQAPLAEVPAHFTSRMVITNTGPQGFAFRIEVLGETGNVISTGVASGVVQARSTRVLDLRDVLTGFTAEPRAALKLTVAAPDSVVRALYQVVNPDAGAISNHVMVRPGSN